MNNWYFSLLLLTLLWVGCSPRENQQTDTETSNTDTTVISEPDGAVTQVNTTDTTTKVVTTEDNVLPAPETRKDAASPRLKPETKINVKKEPEITKTVVVSTKDNVAGGKIKVADIAIPSNTAVAIAPKSTPENSPTQEAELVSKPNHEAFSALLKKYVSASGKVNYAGIKANKADLEAYLADLDANPVAADWSRNEKMAYWINAYNAFTLKLIVDNYPLKSITNLHGGKPWDRKWIELGGKTYSLNQIENDIIRPQFKDARIHFAVNCAAVSCPPLLNQAFMPATLTSQLQARTKAFINNPAYTKLEGSKASVSKIFDWYKVDFDNLVAYINKFAAAPLDAEAEISFQEYDWSLND